ncbi:MAG: hypothetical protein A2X05_02945 [Bacteroidetes bacterium GWE2_41_25]|nr:MAG: hypothetical protein A2X03_05935 [Bacteroidetes bacterium GWA2_40_15]OFX91691.1 MAG: hypothetical protein A2X05_02945 [Bacteroidetes bacterium GWE2_41_25]OFX97616.1 MAG: hypothetical protein A2X06_17510 [Bacteroidetes bacterium GWC2_40_22]HAM09526.1 hypothetical protein [Bacteroidales bacterium]HBH83868.1 hypothetical protein [Bacteroidales bacterium]
MVKFWNCFRISRYLVFRKNRFYSTYMNKLFIIYYRYTDIYKIYLILTYANKNFSYFYAIS